MTRFLIYLFPAMMDLVLGCVFFVCTRRAAEAGMSATAEAAVLAAWALAYMLVSLVAGRLVTPRNAAALLIGSCAATAAIAAGFILIPTLSAVYPLIALQAAASAFFFCPFQVFMKAVERGRAQGVVRSTALYTFAWSMGMAAGPFVAGFVWSVSDWWVCHVINGCLAVVTAAGVVRMKHHAHPAGAKEGECRMPQHTMTPVDAEICVPAGRPQAVEAAAPGTAAVEAAIQDADYAKMPDLAWLGWVASGVGCLTVSLIRSVFLMTGHELHLGERTEGTTLAILSAAQALVGLSLIAGRTWMYRPSRLAMFGAAGVASLILFAVGRSAGAFYLAAALYGVYSGGFFFYLVFHSLVHPSRSARYIAVNEAVVGITGVAGPLAGGAIMDGLGLGAPYLFSAILVALAVSVQVVVHLRVLKKKSQQG